MSGTNAFGTTISKGDGSDPQDYTAVGSVLSISGPSLERETYDVTAHDSTDGWREFIGGLKDGGEVEFDVNYDPDEHAPLTLDDFEGDDPIAWELAFPSGSTWEFDGILTSAESEAPHDGKLEGSFTIKVSGKPTFSEAS